jgi:hypothetical protein
MKQRIPREIDDLMWSVVESGDMAAIDQFADRYPMYKAELGKRLGAVRKLRASRPGMEAAHAPRFTPKSGTTTPLPSRQPRWAMGLAAAAALSALAFGSTVAYRELVLNRPAPVVRVEPVPTDPVEVPEVAVKGPTTQDYRVYDPDKSGTVPPRQPEPRVMPWDKPIAFRAEGIRLMNAIEAIAMQGSLTIEVAPGMPDISINLDYQDASAISILRALGQNFGFTVLEQQPGTVLLVPERDPNAAAGTVASGHSEEVETEPPVSDPTAEPRNGTEQVLSDR